MEIEEIKRIKKEMDEFNEELNKKIENKRKELITLMIEEPLNKLVNLGLAEKIRNGFRLNKKGKEILKFAPQEIKEIFERGKTNYIG